MVSITPLTHSPFPSAKTYSTTTTTADCVPVPLPYHPPVTSSSRSALSTGLSAREYRSCPSILSTGSAEGLRCPSLWPFSPFVTRRRLLLKYVFVLPLLPYSYHLSHFLAFSQSLLLSHRSHSTSGGSRRGCRHCFLPQSVLLHISRRTASFGFLG